MFFGFCQSKCYSLPVFQLASQGEASSRNIPETQTSVKGVRRASPVPCSPRVLQPEVREGSQGWGSAGLEEGEV